MRKVGLGLVLLAAAVGFGVAAEAGPANGKPVGLYVGHYPGPGADSETVKPRVQVGSVVFRPACGRMFVKIVVEKGAPNTEFGQVFLVHLDTWGPIAAQGQSLTTDANGHAELCFSLPIPADAPNNVFAKVIVRSNGRDGIVYVTERHHIPLKKNA